jgi:uncharacterized protein YecT (DUF1311 family)
MTNLAQWMGAGYVALALLVTATATSRAQDAKPTPQQSAAIRACAEKNQNDVTEAERQCLFNIVAAPCQSTPEGQSNPGMADCFRLEAAIWDGLLNDNFQQLRNLLDNAQLARARDLQRAWIASRDATCGFYDVKIQGSMAVPMAAACLARESARRALLLRFFTDL